PARPRRARADRRAAGPPPVAARHPTRLRGILRAAWRAGRSVRGLDRGRARPSPVPQHRSPPKEPVMRIRRSSCALALAAAAGAALAQPAAQPITVQVALEEDGVP